jgi:kumamolisin
MSQRGRESNWSMNSSERTALPGSVPPPIRAEERFGVADPSAPVLVTLYLRPRSKDTRSSLPADRSLSREEYAAAAGADPADIAAIESFARRFGLDVVSVDPGARRVQLAGLSERVGSAFGVGLVKVRRGNDVYLSYESPVLVPVDVAEIIQAVLGLDTRPAAEPR